MQKSKQSVAIRVTYWLKVVSLGLILGLGLQFAQAWTAPTVAPPGGNVAGPLTTGAISQVKSGGLTTGGLAAPAFVDSDNPTARYVNPSGTSSLSALSLPLFLNCDLKTDVAGSVYCGVDATAAGGGDNMGDHIAQRHMYMNGYRIYGLVGGGGNSIGWGGAAGTGNGIYSDGANGNMAVRMSGSFYIQNQTGTGPVPLIAGNSLFTGAMSLSNNRITNVGNPVDATDAATKGYVDGKVAASSPGLTLYGPYSNTGVSGNTGPGKTGNVNIGAHDFCAMTYMMTISDNHNGGVFKDLATGNWMAFSQSQQTHVACFDF